MGATGVWSSKTINLLFFLPVLCFEGISDTGRVHTAAEMTGSGSVCFSVTACENTGRSRQVLWLSSKQHVLHFLDQLAAWQDEVHKEDKDITKTKLVVEKGLGT